MHFTRGRLVVLLVFGVYWPALFYVSHRPIPRVVYEARVSDKNLHFVAYLIFAYLVWFGLFGGGRIRWSEKRVWQAVFFSVSYGFIDEFLQFFASGRNCHVLDFLANLIGLGIGFLFFSFLSFVSSTLFVLGTAVFVLENVSRVGFSNLPAFWLVVAHFASYGFFTFIWLCYLCLVKNFEFRGIGGIGASFSVPLCLLALSDGVFKVGSGHFAFFNFMSSFTGIAAVCGIWILWRRRMSGFLDVREFKP